MPDLLAIGQSPVAIAGPATAVGSGAVTDIQYKVRQLGAALPASPRDTARHNPRHRRVDLGAPATTDEDRTATPTTTARAVTTGDVARSGQRSSTAEPARSHPGGFGWPLRLRPPIVRRFDRPLHDWLPGHRGVDLGGVAGQPVLASGNGVVVFAGEVAGKPVVSIDHPGGLRTTYEPVRASVPVGRRVVRGEVLGVLEPGHSGCGTACLHWGLRRGREYLDPLGLIHFAPLRLKPVRPHG